MLRFTAVFALYVVGSLVVLGAAANYAENVLKPTLERPAHLR